METHVDSSYEFGSFFLDPVKRLLFRNGERLPVSPKALDILLVLIEKRGQVVEKDQLVSRIWSDTVVEENNLTRNISSLRKALGESPSAHDYIVTVPGRGYSFVADVIARPSGHAAAAPFEIAVRPDTTSPRHDQIEVRREPAAGERRWWRTSLLLSAAVLVAAAAGRTVWVRVSGPAPDSSTPPVTIVPFTSFPGAESMPAFSPDGSQIAFVWDGPHEDNADIYVKLVDAGTPLRLTTSPHSDHSPAWSPDGRSVAFIRSIANEREILIVPSLGGVERRLYSQPWVPAGLSWSPDGKLLAFADRRSPREPHFIVLLSVDRTEPRQLTFPPADSSGDWAPSFSPDGRMLAFVRASIQGNDIYLVPAAGGDPKRLTSQTRPSIKGLNWTSDGARVVFSSGSLGNETLWVISASGGTPQRITVGGENAVWPSVSRHGHRLAYTQESADMNIWRVGTSNAAGQESPTQLIASSRHDAAPQFSPDGRKIAFRSDRSGNSEIWVCDGDGSSPVQLTSFGGPHTGTPRWSPDGRRIAFDSRPEGHADVFVISADGGLPRRVTTEPSNDGLASWSLNGRWIYFGSDRSGGWQVWKVPAEGGPAVQVTKNGGFAAFESPGGALLYYAKFREPGLWQIPVEGGEETLALDLLRADLWGYWAVTRQGLFFLRPEAQADHSVKFFVDYFSFNTRNVTRIAALEKDPDAWGPGLSVSPDGRWIVYNQLDHHSRDIILMDNFR
jgi:Tol biopolymer transport system component/DNA-binding winged helix-turn-helix (wHTH) protein